MKAILDLGLRISEWTKSELVREALRMYIEERRWRKLLKT